MKGENITTDRASVARRRYSRRDFLKLGGAGLAGAALLGTAGCGGGGQQGGNVVFAYGATGTEDVRTVRQLIDQFNSENESGITVEFQNRSEITDEYFRSLVSDFQAGSAEVDVIGGDVIWAAQFAANGWIEDLSSRIYSDYEPQAPDAFLQAPITTVSYQNSLWGVPWFTDVGVLYYRQDLLEEAGFSEPPGTWQELKDMATQVKEQSGVQDGFVFQGADYEGGVVNGAEFIWNAGGSILEGNISTAAPGQVPVITPNFVDIDNPSTVEGLQIERSMITDNVAPQAVADYTETDSNDVFMSGNAVFQRGWPYMYATFGTDDSQISQDQVGITSLPTVGGNVESWSCLGGWNMYMNRRSQNKDAAWEFIQFMTAPEQQRLRAVQGSFLPTLESLYEDQEILNQVPVIQQVGDIVRNDARSRPVTPYYSVISRRLATGFHEVLTGEVEPQQETERLQQELRNIVQQRS